MTLKNAKTILFASLLVAMILPFSGMNNAYADKQIVPYTLAQIDHAFSVSDGYVTVDQNNQMKVDKKEMKKDGISKLDIKIMKKWAKIHNKTMEVRNSGDPKLILEHFEKIQNGKFRLLVDTTVPAIGVPTVSNGDPISAFSHSGQSFWSLTACGITYGQTQHTNPTANVGLNGYSSVAAAQTQLSNWGYTQLQVPYTDPQSVGFDYGKINSNGIGGCTGGEFRDEHFIYDSDRYQNGVLFASAVHTLKQVNEPNPNLAEYNPPTYWWDTYTFFWHIAN